MTFDRDTALAEFQRKEARKFNPLPVRDNRRRGESVVPASAAGGGGFGAFIHLTRNATQSISSSGEAILWDTLGLQGVSGFTETVATTTVTILQAGYYNIAVQFGWSSFISGGTVTVKKNTETVWPPSDDPGLWSSTDGQLFEGTAHSINCAVGDTLSVDINPDDASARTLASATLTVYLVDRAANEGLYRELVMSHGPVGYWRLDEPSGTNAADETGSNDGTYANTPTLDQLGVMQDGSGSPSVEFDGGTEYVAIPQAAVDGLSDLSIEAWIDFDSTAKYCIFAVNDSGGDGYNRWVLWVNASQKLEWADGVDGTLWNSTATLAADMKHHVVVTRSAGGILKFYINGVLDSTHTSVSTSVSSSGDTVQIGMDLDAGAVTTDFFDGNIDEVALYDRILIASEIQEHYLIGS